MNRDPRALTALLDELDELARHAPARLGERVAALTLRDQAELALRLPARQRLELLLHAPAPLRLVRSLPDSEFYLTVRELGPNDALAVVALGSAGQLQHLLDLESWSRDRFRPEICGAWVALVLEAGEPAARRLLRTTDDDALALLFQRWFRVEPIVPEDGPDEHGHGRTETDDAEGLGSPDGALRFRPAHHEHAPAMQRLAQLLFLEQPERYQRATWGAMYELPAELEEHALHWRQSRLEEHGFPPWEEAIGVYAPPAGVREHPPAPEPTDPDGLSAPLAPLRLDAERERLVALLDRLADADRERALGELVGVANRLLVADGGDTGDPAAHRGALACAAGYVWIALETHDADDPARAAAALARQPLIELFRQGHGRAAELQRRARALLADGRVARELVDPPHDERLAALLEPRPAYLALGAGGRAVRRPFRSVAEIDETRESLDLVEVVVRLLVERLGLDLSRAPGESPAECAEPPRLSTFVLTGMAWHATRGELRCDPLPPDVVADFLREVAAHRHAGAEAPARALGRWLAGLRGDLGLGPLETGRLAAFGQTCLERLAEECAALDPDLPVDPRWVACLRIARAGTPGPDQAGRSPAGSL